MMWFLTIGLTFIAIKLSFKSIYKFIDVMEWIYTTCLKRRTNIPIGLHSQNKKYYTIFTSIDGSGIHAFNVKSLKCHGVHIKVYSKEDIYIEYPLAHNFGYYFGLNISPSDFDVKTLNVEIIDNLGISNEIREFKVHGNKTVLEAINERPGVLVDFKFVHNPNGLVEEVEDGSLDQD